MPSVQEIAQEIADREGGFVNDPDDPGGPTNHGVTLDTLERLGRDVTRDGRIDIGDVKALDREAAVRIFIDHYFEAPGIDGLPAPLQPSVFDMYVNSGDNAVRILQRLLGDMGLRIAVDGIIGPETTRTAEVALAAAPHHLVDAYGIARRNYYYALADRRPTLRKYARRQDGGKGGWILRAEEFISPRYRLSATEHTRRTAEWA